MLKEPALPSCELKREASAWQGASGHRYPESDAENASADLMLNAWLGRLTGGISPAALGAAWQDWTSHLLLAPTKQAELVRQAADSTLRWLQFATGPALSSQQGELEPLPQDRRFSDPAWRRWPYNLAVQGFLAQQQWWHRATTGVRGMSHHHTDVASFVARQLLDWMAPSNFVSTNPLVQEAALASGGLTLAAGSLRAMRDGWDAWTGAPRPSRYRPGREVALTPGKVVLRNRLIELIRYDPATPQVHSVPLLIVPAWIMKYYILDLSPHNSLVRYLTERGHTVFMISWKNPDAADRDLSMDDYRTLGVMAALDAIGSETGAPRINACGYCLGGTLLAIAAAAMARDNDERLASLTLLAAQVDFTEPGELSLFIDDSEVSFLEAAMWQRGYLDTRQMAGAFQLLRSNDLIWSRRLRHYLLNLPEADSDLMAWNADATRMPYRMHSEYLHELFLHNALATGRYMVDGRAVALTDITAPVFAVGTLTDHVAPWRSVYKLVLLTDTEVSFLLTSGGHNAGVVAPPGNDASRSFQLATHAPTTAYLDPDSWQQCAPAFSGSWWPAWADWLDRHAGPLAAPPPPGLDLGAAPGAYVLQP